MQQQNVNPLKVLVGMQLGSVEFVRDYVQLHFDGPTLTAYTRPRVWVMNKPLEWGQKGYRDALCDRIGTVVRQAGTVQVGTNDKQEIRIEFDDGAIITVSTELEVENQAEAAMFTLPDNEGEPPHPIVIWN